jgi:Flp pilus assembly protein TadG
MRKTLLHRFLVRDERGAGTIIAGLAFAVLAGTAALAVDMGMLYTARSEAQRAADAAALAGANALIVAPGNHDFARGIARRTAEQNTIRQAPVELLAGDITVTATELTVHARRLQERGNPVTTWFARTLGVRSVDVAARASAGVFPAGAATCLKPFIVPDLWHDVNGNGRYDAGELYQASVTGYGTDFRKDGFVRDLGRPITLYPGTANQGIVSSWYFLLRIPGNQGGDDIRRTIASTECNRTILSVGDEIPADQETGIKKGPVRQGFNDLIALDPNATWDPVTRMVRNSVMGPDAWRASPRVVTIALFDPREPVAPGARPIRITNFATVFIERTQGDDIIGRFLPTVGISTGTDCRTAGNCAPFASHTRLTG